MCTCVYSTHIRYMYIYYIFISIMKLEGSQVYKNTYIQHMPTYNDIFVIGDEPPKRAGFGTSGFTTTAITIPTDPLNNQGYTDLPVEYWKSRTAFGTSGFGTDSGQDPFGSGHDHTQGGFTTTAMTRRFNTGGNRGGGGSSGY